MDVCGLSACSTFSPDRRRSPPVDPLEWPVRSLGPWHGTSTVPQDPRRVQEGASYTQGDMLATIKHDKMGLSDALLGEHRGTARVFLRFTVMTRLCILKYILLWNDVCLLW